MNVKLNNQCAQHNEQAIYLERGRIVNQRILYCQKCVGKNEYPHNLLLIKEAEAFICKNEQIILGERKITNQKNLELLLKLKEQLFQFQSQLSQSIEQIIQDINKQIQVIITADKILEQNTREALQRFIYENCDIDKIFEELIDYKSIKKTIACSLMPIQILSFEEQQQQFLKEIQVQSNTNSLEQIKDFFFQEKEKLLIRNQRCQIHELQLDIVNIDQKNQYRLGCMKCEFDSIIQKHNIEDLKGLWNSFQRHTEKYIGFHQKANSSLLLLKQHKIALNLLINQLNQLTEPNEDKMDQIQKKTQYVMQKDWSEMTTDDVLSIAKVVNDKNTQLILDDTIQAEIEANQIQIRLFCQNQIQITDQMKYYYQLTTFQNATQTQSALTQIDSNQKTLIDAKILISGNRYELINSFKDSECKAIAFSSDSAIMIAGYCNGVINVYEFKLGFLKLIQQLKEHRNMITCLNFMKKSMSFISGSKDMSIIIWLKDKSNWHVQQKLVAHSDWVVCMIINNTGNLIISGSDDKSIKFWAKSSQWNHSQTLIYHSGRLRSLSLNQSQNQLISCAAQDDRIFVSQCENNNTWVLVQVIQQVGYRICFLNNQSFSVQPMKSQEMQVYELNQKNQQFQLSKQIQVKSGNGCDWLFPKQFINSKQLLINKNGQHVNIIRLRDNGDMITEQSIDFETYFLYGAATDDGEFLVTWNAKSQEIQIRKYRE